MYACRDQRVHNLFLSCRPRDQTLVIKLDNKCPTFQCKSQLTL